MRQLTRPLRSGIGNQLVTIEVGEEKQQFSVHQDLLTASSKFFKAAFEGDFREATTKRIPLLDTTPQVVQEFLNWLYFRRLSSRNLILAYDAEAHKRSQWECCYCGKDCPGSEANKGKAGLPHSVQSTVDEKIDKLLLKFDLQSSLYVFGYRYDIRDLRRDCLDHFWYAFNVDPQRLPDWCELIWCMESLPITSPLFKFHIDLFVERYIARDYFMPNCPIDRALAQKVPAEFLFAVMNGLSNKQHGVGHEGLKALCGYHEHPQDEASVKACTNAQAESRSKKRKALDLEDKAHEINAAIKRAK